jgi:hypothetical protein
MGAPAFANEWTDGPETAVYCPQCGAPCVFGASIGAAVEYNAHGQSRLSEIDADDLEMTGEAWCNADSCLWAGAATETVAAIANDTQPLDGKETQ